MSITYNTSTIVGNIYQWNNSSSTVTITCQYTYNDQTHKLIINYYIVMFNILIQLLIIISINYNPFSK